MGHAGAIIGGKDDTAAAKMKIMRECGLIVAESPANIGNEVKIIYKWITSSYAAAVASIMASDMVG